MICNEEVTDGQARVIMGKMVNGSRFYRALESVSIASALSFAALLKTCLFV